MTAGGILFSLEIPAPMVGMMSFIKYDVFSGCGDSYYNRFVIPMRQTSSPCFLVLILGLLLVPTVDLAAEDFNDITTKQYFSEAGVGYLGGGGGFLFGCFAGGIIVPRTDEHMSAAFPAALAGYSLGTATGVFLWGEKYQGRSNNGLAAFGAGVAGAVVPMLLGYISNNFSFFTLGLLSAPFASAAAYSATKEVDKPKKTFSVSFSFTF